MIYTDCNATPAPLASPPMFSALKNFINDLTGEAERPKAFEAADYQLAAAALLVHIASVDGEFDDKEKVAHPAARRGALRPSR